MPAGIPSGLAEKFQVNGTNQAANTEITETVPAGKWWHLVAFSVSLVQGITQTPQPFLVIDDGTDVILEIPGSSAAQAASTTCRYTWAPGLTLTGQIGVTTGVRSVAPLPSDLILAAGFRIKTATIGLGANSDYAAGSLYVIEYSS